MLRRPDAREGGALLAPIVLVHGFAQQASTWDKVALLLSCAGVECFAFELAGHGAGARSTGGDPAKRLTSSTCASRRERSLLFVGSLRATQVWRLFWLGTPWAAALRSRRRALLRTTCGMAASSTAFRSEAPQPSLHATELAALTWLALASRDVSANAVQMFAAVPFSVLVLESAGLGPVDDAAREALRERNFAWAARVRDEGVSAFMDWWASLPLFESQRNLTNDQRERLRVGRLANDTESLALSFERAGRPRDVLAGRVDSHALRAGCEGHSRKLSGRGA